MSLRTLLTALCAALSVLGEAGRLHAQGAHVDMHVYSTAPGGGALTLDFGFEEPIGLFRNLCVVDRCLYASTNPGFNMPPADQPGRSLYLLRPRTALTFEIVALDPGVSVKIGTAVLNAPGARAGLGTTPDIHVHPSWQVTIPAGQSGTYQLRFRLTTSSRFYDPSAIFTLRMRAGEPAPLPTPTATFTATLALPTSTATPTVTPSPTVTPTGTATPSPTPTPTPPSPSPTRAPAVGADANCDGSVTAADLVETVRARGATVTSCGADPAPDGRIDDADVLHLIRALFATP